MVCCKERVTTTTWKNFHLYMYVINRFLCALLGQIHTTKKILRLWFFQWSCMDVRVGLWRKLSAFELWCWRRLLRVPWTVRRSNQSILKKISPGCSVEGLILRLKLQYFGHIMWRVDSLEKTLMLGGVGARRRRERQRRRWMDGITDSVGTGRRWV